MATLPLLRKLAVITIGLGLLALAGCEKAGSPSPEAGAPAAPAAPAASAAPKPATPNSFDDVTAQLDPGGDLYFYLGTAQWLGKLSAGIDSFHDFVLSGSNTVVPDAAEANQGFVTFKDMVDKSGLEDISGIGASSFEVSPGFYRNKFFVHHYPDKATGMLWSLYGKAPHALAGLDLLPANTATAGFGDFDLAMLINFLRQEAEQSGIPEVKQAVDQWQTEFAGVTQLKLDDVLASLNGSMGMVITLDATSTLTIPVTANQQETIPTPRIALLIAVKNDLIFKQVDKSIGAQPGIIKVDDPDLQMRTMQAPPMVPGLNLRPTVAQWNGYLVIASDDQLIRDMVAVQKGGPGFKSTPEYATLSAGLPAQGNSFGLVTQRFADTMKQVQGQMFANQPGLSQSQAAMLTHLMEQYQKSGPMYAVGSQLPNGWLTIGQGSQGAEQMLAPMVIAPAIAASIALPAFSAAHAAP